MSAHKDRNGHSPMKILIEHSPEAAEVVMDHCVQRSRHIRNVTDPEYSVKYDFSLLDPGPEDPAFVRGKRFFGPTTMVKYGRKKLLRHPLTVKLLSHKWSVFGRVLYYLNFLSYLVFILLYSIFIIKERQGLRFVRSKEGTIHVTYEYTPEEDDDNSDGTYETFNETVISYVPSKVFHGSSFFTQIFSYVVLGIAVCHILKEILQLLIQRFKYFTDITNLLEWILYSTTIVFMIPYTMPDKWVDSTFKQSKQKTFMWINGLVSIFLCYVNLVLFLRRFRILGIYVTMYVEVTKTVLKVILVFSVFILGFTIVFFVLFKEQVSWTLLLVYLT